MGLRDFLSNFNIGDYFKGVEFPCSKQELIDFAEEHSAPERIIEMLDKLPDKEYESIMQVVEAEVWSAF